MTDNPAVFLAELIAGFSANSIEALCRQIYEPAITADLEALRPAREKRAEDARQARDEAWAAYTEVAPRMSALEGRLAEAERYDPAAGLDVEESSITDWRAASAQAVSNERLKDELRQRIALIRPIFDERVKANGQAKAGAESADAALAELDAAVADPFGTPLGKATPGFEMYCLYTGKWRSHLAPDQRGTPSGRAARKIVRDALSASGYLAELEREAVDRHHRQAELSDRVRKVNAGPGDPHWQGSLEREGDRTPLGPVVPGVPGHGGNG
jgi:hypothetical protein